MESRNLQPAATDIVITAFVFLFFCPFSFFCFWGKWLSFCFLFDSACLICSSRIFTSEAKQKIFCWYFGIEFSRFFNKIWLFFFALFVEICSSKDGNIGFPEFLKLIQEIRRLKLAPMWTSDRLTDLATSWQICHAKTATTTTTTTATMTPPLLPPPPKVATTSSRRMTI